MAKSLIITEKPSVAQEFARILGVSGRNDGYIENSDYVITWCVGHLVEMVYPEVYDEKYKKWKLEDLPFLPKDYKYDVIPAVSRQYDVVHKMLHREDIDTVYWAGDAGKEGQTIEENGVTYTPDMVLGPARKGLKITYTTDTRPTESILHHAPESDLFICEGMYGEDDKADKAKGYKHMTFREAAVLARNANVQEMWLTHYSPSLVRPDDYMDKVREIFPNAFPGKDGKSVELNFEDEKQNN